MGEADFDIVDVENWGGAGKKDFSFETLLMIAVGKCINSGSHELRTGWFSEGKYIEDTRKKFIESVKSLNNLLVFNYDRKAKKNIKSLKKKLKIKKKKLLEAQFNWYNSLPPVPKKHYQGQIISGFFAQDLGWYQKYLEYEVNIYRRIFTQLMNLIGRKNYFGERVIE